MVKALECPKCSAPLPAPSGSLYVVCSYCGTTAQLEQAAPQKRAPEAPSPYPNDKARADFGSHFLASTMSGMAFVPALQEAARLALERYGDQSAMVNTVARLVLDFERETGAEVHADPMVIVRVVQAYYQVADEVARTGTSEINLPFLGVAASGPAHLQRKLSADDLASLGKSPPPEPAPKLAPAPEPAPEPKKKKGWFW